MEANQHPSVFIAKSKPPASTTSAIPKTPREAENLNQEMKDRVPTAEWRQVFKQRFVKLRKIIEQERKVSSRKLPSKLKDGLPNYKDETAWLGLLYGDSTSNEDKNDLSPASPLLPYSSVVLKMDQRTTLALLEYHTDWLDEESITRTQAQWLFALLLRVDKLLTSDSISTLRELCRQWGSIRSKLNNPSISQVASLNMLISIVIDYFEQMDLWEEINSS
ncbi:hypothetical protein K7432_002811 [Basidiobolus ranarum]